MPSSAHTARLQIPPDALDVFLPLPHSTHRRHRRVFINAQQRSTDKPCMPSSAHAARLPSPQATLTFACFCLSFPTDVAGMFLLTPNGVARTSHACHQAPTRHAYKSHRTPSTSVCLCLTRPIDVADVFLYMPNSVERTRHAAHATRLLSPRSMVQTHIIFHK